MPLRIAIAFSSFNKAKNISEAGEIVFVQQYFGANNSSWFHVWSIKNGKVEEHDISDESLENNELLAFYDFTKGWLSL